MRPMQRILWMLTLVACAPSAAAAADDRVSAKPAAPLVFTVTTAEGDQVSGSIAELSDGKLTLDTAPPQSFTLADLERIEPGASAATAAEANSGDLVWLGQDNHDLVQVGGAPGGNGIQDVHLRINRLSNKAIKQIAVVCRFPKLLRVWRLDTSASPHWRLAIARSELASEADLYIEPPAGDSFDMKFEATVIYNDGETSKSSVTALTHTSDALKVDRQTKPGEPSTKSEDSSTEDDAADVFLAGLGRLRGKIVSLSPQSLVLRTTWDADVEVPVLHVRGVWFGRQAPAGTRAKFDERLAEPGSDDVVFVAAQDNSAAEVAGQVQGLADDKLTLRYQGEDRPIKQDRLLGLVFTAHAKLPPLAGTHQVFLLGGDQSIAGNWVAWRDGALEVLTPWQSPLQLPAAAIHQIRIRNGKIVYLPDLEPIEVEELGYFGRVISWRSDKGFDGGPPVMNGKKPVRSLAMHSRCVLTYALNGQFDKFVSTVGFDDSGQHRGRVACRILADGRELFSSQDLRATQDALPIDVAVDGAQQLTLEVDFGADADIGDRVLWAEPRLFRTSSQK
jgi:hypothetical protein